MNPTIRIVLVIFATIGLALLAALAWFFGANSAAASGAITQAAAEKRVDSVRARLNLCLDYARSVEKGEATAESSHETLKNLNKQMEFENQGMQDHVAKLQSTLKDCQEQNADDREKATGSRELKASTAVRNLGYERWNLERALEGVNSTRVETEATQIMLLRALRHEITRLRKEAWNKIVAPDADAFVVPPKAVKPTVSSNIGQPNGGMPNASPVDGRPGIVQAARGTPAPTEVQGTPNPTIKADRTAERMPGMHRDTSGATDVPLTPLPTYGTLPAMGPGHRLLVAPKDKAELTPSAPILGANNPFAPKPAAPVVPTAAAAPVATTAAATPAEPSAAATPAPSVAAAPVATTAAATPAEPTAAATPAEPTAAATPVEPTTAAEPAVEAP